MAAFELSVARNSACTEVLLVVALLEVALVQLPRSGSLFGHRLLVESTMNI